jgi:hypothetical protein
VYVGDFRKRVEASVEASTFLSAHFDSNPFPFKEWRRGRDSNPRNLSVLRFSRPVQ